MAIFKNKILHDLVCQNCNNLQLNGISSINTNQSIEILSHQKLVEILNNFEQKKCTNCNTKGKWIVSKIFIVESLKE